MPAGADDATVPERGRWTSAPDATPGEAGPHRAPGVARTGAGPYTPAQVAERVGATEWFVKNLAAQRLVPCLRVGRGAVRFTDEHVAAVIAHLTQDVEETPTRIASSRRRAS